MRSFLLQKYLAKTLQYLFKNTSYEAIREVIIVDDASTIPVTTWLFDAFPVGRIADKIRIHRFSEQGNGTG